MELKWLEDMIVLLEEGSFSKAAKRRNVTQPAFSRRIQSLEQWLGNPIVDRSVSPVKVLESALSCEAEVRELAKRFHELRGRLRSESRGFKRLNFAVQHSLAVSVFPDLIDLIKTEIMPISYRLKSANFDDCLAMSVRGDVDFMLCYETNETIDDALGGMFNRYNWGRDILVPVVGGPLCYLLDEKDDLPDPVPFLAYPDTSFMGRVLNQSALSHLTENHSVDWVCESSFAAGVKEMVLGGIGMAWLPLSLIWRDLKAGRMVSLAPHLKTCELNIVLYGNVQSHLAKTMMDKIPEHRSYKQYQ